MPSGRDTANATRYGRGDSKRRAAELEGGARSLVLRFAEAVAQLGGLRLATLWRSGRRRRMAASRRPPRGPQAGAGGMGGLWSFSKLWVALISRHSDRQAALPRRRNRSQRRLN